MSITLRRTGPMLLISILIIIINLNYFISNNMLKNLVSDLTKWATIGSAIALIYAISVEIIRYIRLLSIKRTPKEIINNILFFAFTILFVAVGLIYGGSSSTEFNLLFERILAPSTFAIETVYGLMLVSSAYRTLRASTLPAIVLMISALFMLFRNAPLITTLIPQIATVADWLQIPLTGGSRGALIGAGIGALMISLRASIMKEQGLVEVDI